MFTSKPERGRSAAWNPTRGVILYRSLRLCSPVRDGGFTVNLSIAFQKRSSTLKEWKHGVPARHRNNPSQSTAAEHHCCVGNEAKWRPTAATSCWGRHALLFRASSDNTLPACCWWRQHFQWSQPARLLLPRRVSVFYSHKTFQDSLMQNKCDSSTFLKKSLDAIWRCFHWMI